MTKEELREVRRCAVNASIGVDLMLDEISKAHKRIKDLENENAVLRDEPFNPALRAKMVDDLRAQIKDLETINAELADKVGELTAKLRQAQAMNNLFLHGDTLKPRKAEPVTQPGEAFIRGIRPDGIAKVTNALYVCPGREEYLELPELPNDPWNAADLIGCIVQVLQAQYAAKHKGCRVYLDARYEAGVVQTVDVTGHQKVGGKWKVFTQIQKRGE